jgi:hypothetical protein
MAAASLDVNFKEELSAIEQCTSILSITSNTNSDNSQGSEFYQKQSAPQHCTVFYSTLLKSKFVSLLLYYSKWRVRTQ